MIKENIKVPLSKNKIINLESRLNSIKPTKYPIIEKNQTVSDYSDYHYY